MRSSGSGTMLWCVAVAAAALLVPVALYARPPVLDFANHAARIWLMNGGAEHPALAAAYAPHWSGVYSNIGIELMSAALAPLIGAWTAARAALALALLAPALGLVALNARLAGRLSWWSVALPALAWTSTLIYGFLNFEIGVGLALAAAAADAAVSGRSAWLAGVWRGACGLLILVFHPFAALFYAALLGALALGKEWESVRDIRAYLRGLAAAASALTPLVLWALLAPRLPLANFPFDDVAATFSFDLRGAAIRVATPLLTYHTFNNAIDISFAASLGTVCFALLCARRARMHAGLTVLALALCLVTVLVPRFLVGTDISVRTGLMTLFAFAAAFFPAGDAVRWRRAAALAALALVFARTAWIGAHWNRAQEDVAAVELALRDTPAGATVLVLARVPTEQGRDAAPIGRYFRRQTVTYWHYGAYAVVDRAAFVPTLFAAESQQPLRVRAPYDEISTPLGCYMIPAQALYDPLVAEQPESRCAPYVQLWRDRFDFVLVLNADERRDANGAFTPPPQLSLRQDAGFARLYQVSRGEAVDRPLK